MTFVFSLHSVRCLAPPASQQYFLLTPLQHQPPATSQLTVFFSHTTPAPAQRTECMSFLSFTLWRVSCVRFEGFFYKNKFAWNLYRSAYVELEDNSNPWISDQYHVNISHRSNFSLFPSVARSVFFLWGPFDAVNGRGIQCSSAAVLCRPGLLSLPSIFPCSAIHYAHPWRNRILCSTQIKTVK